MSDVAEIPTLESDIKYPSYFIPEKTIPDYILRKTKEHIEAGVQHPIWINSITGETVRLVDVEPKSRKIASALTKRNFQKADIVIYASNNVTQLPLFSLAVWRLGGIMRSSYPEDTNGDLLEKILDFKSKWVLCDEELGERYSKFLKDVSSEIGWPVTVFVIGNSEGCTSISELFSDDGKAFPESVKMKLEDPYLILNTSGSTGKSKGAVYTHANSIPAFETAELRKSSSAVLALGRPSHLSGATMPFSQLLSGCPLISMHKASPKAILEAVHKYKPETVFGFPAYLISLVEGEDADQYDRTSVKVIMSGGIAMTAEQRKKLEKLPNLEAIFNFYALTECPRISTTIDIANSGKVRKELPGLTPNCVGKLLPNTSVRIYDDETEQYNGPGFTGEILVKSVVNIKEYWNLPEESEKLYLDGYLRTGDLGFYNENGLLFIADRKKETFKYFNNHISPSEIEGLLKTHPDVEDACVIGVRDTELDGDTVPRAFVVLKANAKQIAKEEIKKFAEDQLPIYKHIRGGLYITTHIPLGKTGKPSRLLLSQNVKIDN